MAEIDEAIARPLTKTERACERCEWWGRERAHDDDMPVGTCRLAAPVPVTEIWKPEKPFSDWFPFLRARWRWTAFDDWCAQFKERG